MKDLTNGELLDAIDSAMKAVVAQFAAKRDAARLRAGTAPQTSDSADLIRRDRDRDHLGGEA